MSADTSTSFTRDPLERTIVIHVMCCSRFAMPSISIPFNVKEYERRRENLIANRGVQSVSTWGTSQWIESRQTPNASK